MEMDCAGCGCIIDAGIVLVPCRTSSCCCWLLPTSPSRTVAPEEVWWPTPDTVRGRGLRRTAGDESEHPGPHAVTVRSTSYGVQREIARVPEWHLWNAVRGQPPRVIGREFWSNRPSSADELREALEHGASVASDVAVPAVDRDG